MRDQQDYERLLEEYKKLEAEKQHLEDIMRMVKADSDRSQRLVKKLKVYRSNWDKVKEYRKKLLEDNSADSKLISLGYFMSELERKKWRRMGRMAYEYESKLYANSVVHSITENVFIETGETKEIKEIYRKAEAFDKISNLIESNYVDYGEYDLKDVEAIINEYWEDE